MNLFNRYRVGDVQWLHRKCLLDAVVQFQELNDDHCGLCGDQLHDEHLQGTVLEFCTGELSNKPGEPESGFEEGAYVLAHWACVGEFTDYPLIYDDLEE
jgi:hypothetical protein